MFLFTMKLNRHFLAFGFFFMAFSVAAYDVVGHRIIADIAYSNLTPVARRKVDKVLGIKGMVYQAAWADEVRSDNKYAYSYPWHYQNLADNMTTTDLKKLLDNPASEGEHLFYALGQLTARLKKDRSDTEALKFLVHFIGDLHQPMHLGLESDKGGNRLEMSWFGRKTNLHSVWDGSIVESRKMSYTEYSRYLQDTFDQRKADYLKADLLQSVEATYAVRNAIYSYDMSNTNNYNYIHFFAANADVLLYRAGIQLANVLNGIYK